MKKMWCLLLVLALSLTLTGCGTDLTEEENQIIAEYIADLLLKYDANYESQYADDTESEEIVNDTEVTTEADTEEISTEEPSSEDVTEETTVTVSTESEDILDGMEGNNPESGDASIPPSDSGDILDIAEIVGIDGVSIVYNHCMFLDRYPSLDQDGAFIYLESDPGYKLVVLKFDIENHTSQDVMVDLLDTEISYKLVLNGSKAAKPMLTILMDDLGTFKSAIPANSEQSAVLVFQMSESLIDKIDSLVVRVAYREEEYTIFIQ